MERRALKVLEKWLQSSRRKPMIVWGARQVGKTYLIRHLFAEQFFAQSYVYVDFRLEKNIAAYCSQTVDPKEIITFISLEKRKAINENTLLIFDEIQECPSIVTSLKYFCQDYPHIPVIATGSMVRIKIQRMTRKRGTSSAEEPFLFPVGKINQMTLYPMSFDEFLLNYNPQLFKIIEQSWSEKVPLQDAYHELAMNTLYKFLLVGGMPEAVKTFIETEDFLETREVLKDLYDNYLSDMELYQASPESIVRSRKVFSGIYRELNRDSRNFSPGLLEPKGKNRDFRNPIDWLTMAYVVHQSFQLKEHVTLPLMQEEDSLFRLYLGDIGMFSWQSGINASSFISKEGQNNLAGIFFENYAALELTARDLKLFYWKGKNNAEMEFLVELNSTAVPLDVKKGSGALGSLDKFRNHNGNGLAIKISQNNLGFNKSRNLLTVPLYEMPFLAADIAENHVLFENQ